MLSFLFIKKENEKVKESNYRIFEPDIICAPSILHLSYSKFVFYKYLMQLETCFLKWVFVNG